MKTDTRRQDGKGSMSRTPAGTPSSDGYWEDYDGLDAVADRRVQVPINCSFELGTLIAAAMGRLRMADSLAPDSDLEAAFEVDPTLEVQSLLDCLQEDGSLGYDEQLLATMEAALTDTVGTEGFTVCMDEPADGEDGVGDDEDEVGDDEDGEAEEEDPAKGNGGGGIAGGSASSAPGAARITARKREKRRIRNQKRRRARRVRDALKFRVMPQLCDRFMKAFVVYSTILNTAHLSHAATSYRGKAAPPGKVIPTLEELLECGYQLLEWEGRTTVLVTDAEGRIIVVLGNAPKKGLPMADVDRAFKLAKDTIDEYHLSVRGPYWSERYGWTKAYIGDPAPFVLEGLRKEALDALVKDPAIQQCAGHASALLAFYFPLKFARMRQMVRAMHKQYPTLPERPVLNSIYTTMSFNLGPRVVTNEHVDTMNYVGSMCSVTCGGNFNYKKGGHLYFTDLKLVVEFPPGATILLPSSLLRHGNTALQDGETRFSFTQYCPHSLIQWEDQEFATQKGWTDERKAEYEGGGPGRWQHILSTFSKPAELAAHHIQVFG